MLLIWNKIIRKIANVLIHKKTTRHEAIINLLSHNENQIEELQNFFLLKNNNLQLKLRKIGSDVDVYKQVILNREYYPLMDFLKLNDKNPQFIIDCGANIGLTSIQFAQNFPKALIISVEPDEDNFNLLKINTNKFSNIKILQNAIWTNNSILKIDRAFRDGQDWSIRTVKESGNIGQMVQAITIDELLSKSSFEYIDLLKMDIEGAENEIFNEKNYFSFLEKTECIAIEIHDECTDRNHIYKVLINAGFTLFNSGELTIGFNFN